MNQVLKRLAVIAFAFSLAIVSSPTSVYAYSPVWRNCPHSDCSAPIMGALVPNSSSFPYASSDMHCRIADYNFYCDNCNYGWQVRNITTYENHEFNMSGYCECGYHFHRLLQEDDVEE